MTVYPLPGKLIYLMMVSKLTKCNTITYNNYSPKKKKKKKKKKHEIMLLGLVVIIMQAVPTHWTYPLLLVYGDPGHSLHAYRSSCPGCN